MRRTRTAPPLIGGPYQTPHVKSGQTITCTLRGEVEVDGLTEDVPIPWPFIAGIARVRSLILCADLVRAVEQESVQAVAHHWGVSRYLVHRWRRALGVARFNEGTQARWRDLASQRLDREARRRGGRASVIARKEGK